MPRKYSKWTEQEVELLSKGIIPEGRNYTNCMLKARPLGIDFRTAYYDNARRRVWTDEERDQLRRGIFPESRPRSAAKLQAYALGILIGDIAIPTSKDLDDLRLGKVPEGWTIRHAKEIAVSMGIEERKAEPDYNKGVSEQDLQALRDQKTPKGWSYAKCRYVAFTHGISYRPTHFKARETRNRKAEEMYVIWRLGRSLAYIAELYGVSRERVRQLIREYIHSNPIAGSF